MTWSYVRDVGYGTRAYGTGPFGGGVARVIAETIRTSTGVPALELRAARDVLEAASEARLAPEELEAIVRNLSQGAQGIARLALRPEVRMEFWTAVAAIAAVLGLILALRPHPGPPALSPDQVQEVIEKVVNELHKTPTTVQHEGEQDRECEVGEPDLEDEPPAS